MLHIIQKTLSEVLGVKDIGYEIRGDYVIYKFTTTSFNLAPDTLTKIKVACLQTLNPPFDIPTSIEVIPIRKGPLFSHVEVHIKMKRRMIDASPKSIEQKIKQPIQKIKSIIRGDSDTSNNYLSYQMNQKYSSIQGEGFEDNRQIKVKKKSNGRKVIVLDLEEENSENSKSVSTENNG